MQLKNVMLKAIVLLVWGVQSVQAQNELPKLPPRTIQDVLAVLNKPTDEIESVKEAKHFLSVSEPKDADSEQLHTYYASKSEALARLGQVNKAMETLNEVVTKYPSKYIYLQMTDLSKLAGYEVELGEGHPLTRALVGRWLLDLKELYVAEKAIQKIKMDACKEELMMNRWHPRRVSWCLKQGLDIEDM